MKSVKRQLRKLETDGIAERFENRVNKVNWGSWGLKQGYEVVKEFEKEAKVGQKGHLDDAIYYRGEVLTSDDDK